MSVPDSPEKRRGPAQLTDDDVIPLLLAANPKVVLNYKVMASLSKGARTHSSLEHRFRKWKARAKEIQAENEGPEEAAGVVDKDGKAKVQKSLAKRPRANTKQWGQDSASEEDGKEPNVAKRAKKGGQKAEDAPVIKAEISIAKKLADASNGGTNGKVKVLKKGTARIVKKTEGLRGGGEEELVELKGKGKSMKVNVVESKANGRKGKTVRSEDNVDEKDSVGEGEGLGEMRFELDDR